jgi:hypothetical protein
MALGSVRAAGGNEELAVDTFVVESFDRTAPFGTGSAKVGG